MSTHAHLIRDLPVHEDFDVVVVGGGPAGCTAAAAAAREGAETILVEATGALGAMGTSGLVPGWCPFSDKKQIIGESRRRLGQTLILANRDGLSAWRSALIRPTSFGNRTHSSAAKRPRATPDFQLTHSRCKRYDHVCVITKQVPTD